MGRRSQTVGCQGCEKFGKTLTGEHGVGQERSSADELGEIDHFDRFKRVWLLKKDVR